MPEPGRQDPAGVVTRALQEIAAGRPDAEHRLWELVYPACLTAAEQLLRNDRVGRHLHPRELVHLCFLKLTGGQMPPCPDRRAFFALASRAMRQAMIETARKVLGRHGDRVVAQLDDERLEQLEQGARWQATDVLALEEALVELARISPRRARALELRFYSHLKVGEVADVLQVSRRLATQELSDGLVWLTERLSGPG